MDRRKLKKIPLFLFIIVLAFEGLGQKPPAELYPLRASRDDVVRAFGEGRMETVNRFSYDYKDKTLTFTYYSSGCAGSASALLYRLIRCLKQE
jgi:hypothetical protein